MQRLCDRRSILLGTTTALLLGARPVLAASGPLIRMEADDNGLPVSGLDENGRYVGMMEAVIDVINAELGWRIEYSTHPWTRAQQYVRQGTLDAFCTGETPERREYARFARAPLFSLDSAWIHYSPNHPRAAEIAQLSSLDQLKSFHIGLERGASWPNPLFGPGWRLTEAEDTFILDGMVRAGRIDLFFEVPELMRFFERSSKREALAEKHLDFLQGGVIGYSFGLRASYPDVEARMAEFDRAHQRAESSGRIEAALRNFSL